MESRAGPAQQGEPFSRAGLLETEESAQLSGKAWESPPQQTDPVICACPSLPREGAPETPRASCRLPLHSCAATPLSVQNWGSVGALTSQFSLNLFLKPIYASSS